MFGLVFIHRSPLSVLRSLFTVGSFLNPGHVNSVPIGDFPFSLRVSAPPREISWIRTPCDLFRLRWGSRAVRALILSQRFGTFHHLSRPFGKDSHDRHGVT